MNFFSPSETSDIVASVIAARGARPPVRGSCCDWDCCGALGWSCARSDTTGARRSATNTENAGRVVIGLDVEVCYPENCWTNRCRASAWLACSRRPAGGVWAHREERPNTRFAHRSGYSLTVRKRNAFAITETELKLIAAPAIIGLRRMPNSG